MQSTDEMSTKPAMSKVEIGSTTYQATMSTTGMDSRSLGSTISADASRASTLTTGFSIMEKRNLFTVILDDEDATPENIEDPEWITLDERYTHAAFDTKQRRKSDAVLKSKSKSVTGDAGVKVFATTINLDDIHIDHTLNTEEGVLSTDIDLEIAPSAFYLPKYRPIMSYPPEIYVELKESPTVFLFDLPSFSYDKGTAEANAVEQENEYYSYITVGKGRNRKTIAEETQTKACITQSRHTLATRPKKKNAIAFASLWDMHDTYARLAKAVVKEEEDEMVMYQSAAPNLLRKKKGKFVITEDVSKTFEEIAKTPQFLDAVMLTERVLAASAFSAQQKKFRGLIKVDPLSKDLIYIYSMKPLWTLEYEYTAGRPITCISFNPKNENILAVGHGKFVYAENFDGFVAVWCTKNPCKPERLYRFKDPLTSLAFSEMKPNWLACGFNNGDVLILDITSYEIKIVAKSKRDTNPGFEPVWSTRWCKDDKENQYLMTTNQDGRINRFTSTKTHEFICTMMMRVTSVEGKMKGLELKKTCTKAEVPITRYPAALCMQLHSDIDHIYYVGTDEGFIHKCSTHYSNQHMEVFRAHAGPVYGIERSPFMPAIMLSCGADSAIRMWMQGVDDVIMTLPCPAAVYGIAFCPKNSTLIISVSGNVLSVWDLRRKTHIPCADYTFASNVVLTYVKFSASGDNVFVGDSQGKIHTFHLEDTPIPPFYQKKLLDEAIKKSLCTRPQLLKQLEKLEKFHVRRT